MISSQIATKRLQNALQGAFPPRPVPESAATPTQAHRNSLFGENFTSAKSPQAMSPMSVPMSGTTEHDWGNSSLPSSIAPPKTGVPYIDKHEVRYGTTYGDAEEATFMTSTPSSFFRLSDRCRLSIEEMAHSVLRCFLSLDVNWHESFDVCTWR